jgi:hypothetical protein
MKKNKKATSNDDLPKSNKQDSMIGRVNSGTRKNHADQPMSGSLGKQGKGKADMRTAGLDTGDGN